MVHPPGLRRLIKIEARVEMARIPVMAAQEVLSLLGLWPFDRFSSNLTPVQSGMSPGTGIYRLFAYEARSRRVCYHLTKASLYPGTNDNGTSGGSPTALRWGTSSYMVAPFTFLDSYMRTGAGIISSGPRYSSRRHVLACKRNPYQPAVLKGTGLHCCRRTRGGGGVWLGFICAEYSHKKLRRDPYHSRSQRIWFLLVRVDILIEIWITRSTAGC